MVSLIDALAQARRARLLMAGTGSADLDSLTGGVRAGQLWAVIGAPRAGRTTAACQIATQAADGVAVDFLAGVEGLRMAIPLVASATGLATWEVMAASPFDSLDPGTAAVSRLGQCVAVFDAGSDTLEAALGRRQPKLLVVDDLDRWAPVASQAVTLIREWCGQSGSAAVVTVPDEVAHPLEAGWQVWVRATDVIVRVEPDATERTGLAWLNVLHHRFGPTTRIPVAYEPWRARLRDVDLEQKDVNP